MKILVLNSGSSSQKSALYDLGGSLPETAPEPCWKASIDFGKDSKSFASALVQEVRSFASDASVENLLRGWGIAVADTLPEEVEDALRQVAAKTAPRPPSVLILSAEPYVPWELTVLEHPLDSQLPPFLGVQTVLGRWLRDRPSAPPAAGAAAQARKPPLQPPGSIRVRNMAVMKGVYKLESGLRPLPEAEAEADSLVREHGALDLPATTQGLKQLLDARLRRDNREIGGAGAVHFAGHGDFNAASPDASVMLLSDGRPLPSSMFRSASYGGQEQPLLFLNACMSGIGDEIFGAMGGFPGNCLRGGFGGVLGALWEVDDAVAREVALDFWRRALPPDGSDPEPVGAILRDLRARYAPDDPVPTYLAYVYYGHPSLTLERVP